MFKTNVAENAKHFNLHDKTSHKTFDDLKRGPLETAWSGPLAESTDGIGTKNNEERMNQHTYLYVNTRFPP